MSTTPSAEKWLDDFTLQLRLREVSGDVIGDQIALVRAHCADSGQTPQRAFGDPVAYANSLDFTPAALEKTGTREWVRIGTSIAAGVCALLIVPQAVAALPDGTIALRWSAVVNVVLVGLVFTGLVLWMKPLLERRALGVTALLVAFAVIMAVPFLFSAIAFTVPAWAALVVGLILLAWSVIGVWRLQGSEITEPRTSGNDHTAASSRRAATALQRLQPWLFVIFTVLNTAVILVARL
jgi:preprotein translocase subunit SecG